MIYYYLLIPPHSKCLIVNNGSMPSTPLPTNKYWLTAPPKYPAHLISFSDQSSRWPPLIKFPVFGILQSNLQMHLKRSISKLKSWCALFTHGMMTILGEKLVIEMHQIRLLTFKYVIKHRLFWFLLHRCAWCFYRYVDTPRSVQLISINTIIRSACNGIMAFCHRTQALHNPM